ncbi:protein PRR14L isoform X1 [Acomys russatus]|uniref:protein PRR14L isoform X1 n=1 Tax=Acomys russatus TaxID=60746 RepID=UPI0021E2B12C|nr:protein PRR14L isoform X1 [Acomys russatus]
MLSSGVETQPIALDSSMPAVVQELYSELSVNVSKELHAEQEPSMIPDVKPGASSSHMRHGRASPLEPQRTHLEGCYEETSETLEYGGKTGPVDPAARGPMAFEMLDREEKPKKSMEPKVFRDEGDQAEDFREPCEEAKEDPCQHSTATKEKTCPGQDVLMQSRKEPVCTDLLPGDLLKNKENVYNTTGILPGSTEDIQGNCAISKMSKEKEELCDLNLVCEEDDSHQQGLSQHKDRCSSAHDSPTATGSIDSIKPLEENSKILCLTSYLSDPRSLEKCGFESNGLIKESAEKTHNVDQSKDFTYRKESKEQYWRPKSERGGLLLFNVRQQELDTSGDGSGKKQTVESSDHSNCRTQSSCCSTENYSFMPDSSTEATEVMLKKNDLKIISNSEDHRKTVTDVHHPGRHSEESSFSLLVHIEESGQTTVKSSAVKEEIDSADSKSVVSIQRDLGDSPPNNLSCTDFLSERKLLQSLIAEDPVSFEHNEISKPKKGTAELPSSPEKSAQTLPDSVSHLDEPVIAYEMSGLSCNRELVAHKIEHECVSHQQVSLNSQDHVTTDSLLNRNRKMPSATCKDAQESCPSLENGANVTTETQTIPAETKMEAMSPQGDRACGASSYIQTLNIKTSPEGQKKITGVHSTLLSSVKEAAGLSFVTECQNVQSQELSSCHCVTRNASKRKMHSACTAFKPRKDIVKVSSCKRRCASASQYSNHCFQNSEDFVESSTLLESEPATRETESIVLGGKVRNETTAGVSDTGALNRSTHVEISEEGLGGKKQDKHRDAEMCEHNTSNCDPQELSQSTNIPSPETLVNQSLTVISSHLKTVYQATESLDQKADEVSDCQSNQDSRDTCRREGKPARKGLSADYRETTEVSYKEKDLIVSLGSKVPLSCGSLKKKDLKRTFENIPGSEEFTHSMLDVVCPDCTDAPTERMLGVEASCLSGHCTRQGRLASCETLRSTSSLQGELNVAFIDTPGRDSELPNAAASTVDSSEIQKLREERVCTSLKDCEVEECPDSTVDHEVESVADHEPNTGALDRGGISLNYIHREHQGEGGSVTEELRLEANSEIGKKKTFGLSSNDSVSSRCQDSMEMVHPCLSSQEHSPVDVHGEPHNLKHLFKPKDGGRLCATVKTCPVLSDMKEGVPMDFSNPREGDDTCISVDKNVCEACHSYESSIDKYLPMTTETAMKVHREETEEHQKGPQSHLPVGEESAETVTRKGHDCKFPKSAQTHLKCQRVHDVAENPQSQRSVDCALPKEEHTYQKGTHALLKQPVADRDESIMMEVTKDRLVKQRQRLEDPKEKSMHHPLKKDTELYTGPSFPGASRKEHDLSSAGGDQIHGAFVTLSYQQRLLPVKKQPHRTCKRISCPEPVTVRRKMSKVRNSDCGKSFSNPVPTKAHRLLSPCAVPAMPLEPEAVASKSLHSHIPKLKATLCHSLRSLSCRKPTKESALINKLSVLASKLTLATKPQKPRYWRCSSSVVALAKNCKRLRYKKLLDGLSHNAMRLDPYLAATGWNRRSSSKSLALYSLEAVKMSFIDLSNKMPSLLFGTEFPFSFHVKSASSCMVESSRTFPEHCAPSRLALAEASQCSTPPPKWTFSFFLSHGCPGMATFREDTGLCSQTHTQAPLQTTAPLQDNGGTAIVQTRADCSVLGLHTLLALCSPGCYRIWTKKRNFSNHMPIMQRLFLTQFTQGLKGLRSPASVADNIFCSLPYSVGRMLSLWSQHGPSCTFKLPALHSTLSKQQGSLSALSR